MSVAASTAIALGTAAAGATAGIYGANKAAGTAENANATTAASNAAAIAEQQRQDAQQKAEFDAQQSALANQWNAEQQIRAPYRAAGQQALVRLGDLIGTNFSPSSIPSTQPYQPATYTGPSSNGPTSIAAPMPTTQPMKMSAMLPQTSSPLMSPGARTVIDPTTGQPKMVLNQ